MPDWQERITRETSPAIRAEHELRYAAAAPFVRASGVWCDLGCGTGVAARAAIGDEFDGRAILVDVDEPSIEVARGAVTARETVGIVADLTDRAALEQIRGALLDGADGAARCVTCFEVIEHLEDIVPLVELLLDLAEHGCAVVLSVPNDAFWSLENPHHRAMWGEGSLDELQRLLPEGRVVAQQVPLHGSALVRPDAERHDVAASFAVAPGVPSHFMIAFGRDAELLEAAPRIVQTDLDGQRRWERQRESDLELLSSALDRMHDAMDQARRANGRSDELSGYNEKLERDNAELRGYIEELERRLAAGSAERADPAATSGGT